MISPRPFPFLWRLAAEAAISSQVKPESEEPKVRQRSLLLFQCSIQSYRSSRKLPSYGTIGFAGSCNEPWISLSSCCGYPAFCGRES